MQKWHSSRKTFSFHHHFLALKSSKVWNFLPFINNIIFLLKSFKVYKHLNLENKYTFKLISVSFQICGVFQNLKEKSTLANGNPHYSLKQLGPSKCDMERCSANEQNHMFDFPQWNSHHLEYLHLKQMWTGSQNGTLPFFWLRL